MIRRIMKKILGKEACNKIRAWRNSSSKIAERYFAYNRDRLVEHSGAFGSAVRECLRARIIMNYHILEKGLTMPNRRFGFGVEVLKKLMLQVDDFECRYGRDEQVDHASGVIRAYFELHSCADAFKSVSDSHYWEQIKHFLSRHNEIPAAKQPHVRRTDFYSKRKSSFPEFAWSRHTLRHYADCDLSLEKIKQAVDIARSTPTACNRQHCHVYCVSNKDQMEKLLAIQGGSRGFGHLANKLLVVTADLQDLCVVRERDDIFVNGGMFLMNLCYALHYYEVAHCILNWSRTPEEDLAMRKIIAIPPSETVIAILSCGEAPDEFDVASSPRKNLNEYFMSL